MLAIILLPLLVAIVGLLVYVLSSNTKVIEVGRCLLWCGVLVTLFVASRHVIRW